MKFGLRFLFALTTIAAIVVAVIVTRQRHERALEKHQQKFDVMIDAVHDLTETLPKAIKAMPGVMDQLKRGNPLAPGNALSGGHSGTSSSGALRQNGDITYRFNYYFPDASGAPTPATTIKVTVSSKVDWKNLGHHTLHVSHKDNELSGKAAKFIEAELLRNKALNEDDYLRIEMIP